MRGWQSAVGSALLAAAVPALAADHREAPAVDERPAADLNDIYAFREDGSLDGRLVLVMTVNPVSDRDFAGTYVFSPNILYRFTIDTNGDAVPEHRIDFVFEAPSAPGVQTFRARIDDLLVSGDATPPSTPDAPVIVEDPVNDITIFAGPRDDPFFFDGAGFNRFVATGDASSFRGIDSFGDLNVSAIVVAFPANLVSDGQDQIAIAASTFPRVSGTFRRAGRTIDRTANPAVASAFIPFSLRDRFNRGLPQNDARDFAPTIAARLQELGTSDENIATLASVAIPDTLKLNLTQADGFPNGRQLEDDVIDTLFSLIFNGGDPTGDGVAANDRPFLDTFPFLAPPFQPAPAP